MAALAASAALQNPDVQKQAGSVISTAYVTGFVFSFVLEIALIVAIGAYWHAIEKAKQKNPNAVGYGHWYFSLIPRILVTAGISILLLITSGILFFTGVMSIKSFTSYRRKEQDHDELRRVERLEETEMQAIPVG